MRVLIVGATGFIGRRLAMSWSQREHCELIVTRRPGTPNNTVEGDYETISLPENFDELSCELSNCVPDLIFNCAAYGVRPTDRNSASAKKLNVDLPCALVEMAATTGATLVQLGSCSEYARSDNMLTESSPPETDSLYGSTKYCGGVLANTMGAALDVRSTYLRLFNIYGPGEAEYRLLPSIIQNAAKQVPIKLSAATQVRDFVFIDDAIDAINKASLALIDGDLPSNTTFNIASGVAVPVRSFVENAADLLKITKDQLHFGALPMRPDDLPRVVGDATYFQKFVNWHPRTSLKDGIAISLNEHYSTHGRAPKSA